MEPVDVVFVVRTPLGFEVRVTRERWRLITAIKHPSMTGREDAVSSTLDQPEQIRQSRTDAQVLLFYRADGEKRWVCAVVKQTEEYGFLITAYPTDAIKEGTQIWPK